MNNKKQNKYIYLKVLQGQYDGCTWDDLAEADLSNVEELKKFKNDVKAYRENESYPHRVIRRRVLNPEWAQQFCFRPKDKQANSFNRALYNRNMKCDRCNKDTNTWTVSMFNEQTICMECKEKERHLPRYKEALEAERAAVKAGNWNFPGIGL